MYRPVTSGIPAILAYPRTSGTPSAASVTPASASGQTRERSSGSTPRSTGRPPQRGPAHRGTVEPGIGHRLTPWSQPLPFGIIDFLSTTEVEP